ncbi:MAG TPA: hypothetical protein VN282_01850 [Pyrinomonadaceae bacterium]|nr:hypothetical protein [Pyrinomonadaceae bacterium]
MNERKGCPPQAPRAPRQRDQRPGNSPAPRLAQPKSAAAPQAKRPPAPPPVYRPQPAPKTAQPKTARAEQSRTPPAAPPVYRPLPTPRVLQAKTAAGQSHAAQPPRLPAAPPFHLPPPAPTVLQRKVAVPTPSPAPRPSPAAPTAHRPGPPPNLLQAKAALPAGAASGGRAAVNSPSPPAQKPAAPAARHGVVQLAHTNRKGQKAGRGRGKKSLDGSKVEKPKRQRRTKAEIQKEKREQALMGRRGVAVKPSVHRMRLRYRPRDMGTRPRLDRKVVEKYVLLALKNFQDIVAAAGKFVKKTQTVKAKRLDDLAFGVNAKFATKASPFQLNNCVAISQRQDGTVIVSANQPLPRPARDQLDQMFPKGYILLECKKFLMPGLHCEIKLWEEVDDFENLPFGVQQLCCLYCAAQLVAVGVTNFLGCHGQTYDHTNISQVIVGQPGSCRRLLGDRVYKWYEKLHTDEQRQFISALEGGGFLLRTRKERPGKLGEMKYGEEAKKIYDVKKPGSEEKLMQIEKDEDFAPKIVIRPQRTVDYISFKHLEEVYDITPKTALNLGVKGIFTDGLGHEYLIVSIQMDEQIVGIYRLD